MSKALKSIPENQAIVLHQYSVDPKAKPAILDISRHFIVDKVANSTIQDEELANFHFSRLLLEFDENLLLLSEDPPFACLV